MSFSSCRCVALMIFSAHLLGFLQLCECQQRCGPGKPKCQNNLCCSTSQYCGETVDHCLTFCDPKYGRCDPFKVNASIGFPSQGNRCGLENNNRYCPNDWCCSEHGFCDRTDEHCGDGCQHYFGQCNVIATCSLPSQHYNIFPAIPTKQRTMSSEKGEKFLFLFCKPGSILKEISQPQPITCNPKDGTWKESLFPQCEENIVYELTDKTDAKSNMIFDGNLLTCLRFPAGDPITIPIETIHFAIRDIRITTHKSPSSNVFTLSIMDIDKITKNETTHWKKTFNGIIEYGKTVVFLSNVTIPLASRWKRFILLELLNDMSICEIEVSSFGQEGPDIKWIAIVTSSIIFFVLAVLILAVLCYRSHSKIGEHSAINGKQRRSSSKNDYSVSDRERAPRPPGSDNIFPDRSSYDCNEDDSNLYEEIVYDLNAPLPPLHNNSARDLLGQSLYDEAISLATVFNRPRLAIPSIPRIPTQ